MPVTFTKLYELLNRRERRNACLLFASMLAVGMLNLVGVASIMPFIAVVAAPDAIANKTVLGKLYSDLGFTDPNHFLIFLGCTFLILIISALLAGALTQYSIARYGRMRSCSLSSRLLASYLRRPYSYFITHHRSDLSNKVLSEANQVVDSCLIPTLQLVASSIVALFLVVLLIVVDPLVAASAIAVLVSAYGAIYFSLRGLMRRIGTERFRANSERYRIANDALGNIKDAKVLGLEASFIRRFRDPAERLARREASAQIIGEIPRYAMEAVVFSGMIALILTVLIVRRSDLSSVLSIVGVYALAGARLMPALQQVYISLVRLRTAEAALNALHRDLSEAETEQEPASAEAGSGAAVRLTSSIELSRVTYRYPEASAPSLRDLSLTIDANTTVGIVGPTGAGKTTLVDTILGLLEPQQGALIVDGQPITAASLRAWRSNVGYVPQQIFLCDDTVAANIAFGRPASEIDMAAVLRAAMMAQIHDFIVDDMPYGYHTKVGDDGIRLSGGQRQRIGIARALYHDPSVLVFDEATSALDTATERAVIDAIRSLARQKTILLIAHRLSTVKICDKIFVLNAGGLSQSGTYDQLLEKEGQFRRLATAS